MKIIFPLIMITLFAMSCSSDKMKNIDIIIEHIGRQDKPILPLVISSKPIDNIEPHTTYCLLSNKTILILHKELVKYYSSSECTRGIYTDFGSFMIKEYTDAKLSKCFILKNKKESIDFFNKLVKILKKNKCEEQIITDLEYFLGSINY